MVLLLSSGRRLSYESGVGFTLLGITDSASMASDTFGRSPGMHYAVNMHSCEFDRYAVFRIARTKRRHGSGSSPQPDSSIPSCAGVVNSATFHPGRWTVLP